MGSEERWAGLKEVAFHFGVAKESIYRWVEKGDDKKVGTKRKTRVS
jgi:hypothetical protein